MSKVYNVQAFMVSSEGISFRLQGEDIYIPLGKCGSTRLENATDEQRMVFELDRDGIGVYWPLIDEDLSISGLLRSAGRPDLIVKDIPSISYQPRMEVQVDD